MTLKELRESKFLTQIQVAASLQVAVATVSNWERGVQTPRLRQMVELAELFGVTPEQIRTAAENSKQS